MELALVRHAVAEPKSAGGDDTDADRALTRDGRRRFRRVSAGLERLELRFDRLLHSPLRRAIETAELLEHLVDGPIESEPLLATTPSDALLARVKGVRPALVGHQPWLGELLSWLVLGDPSRGSAWEWKKGGVALLEGDPEPGGMQVKAFLSPGVLRCVGRR
jgi:phosphohistidine phosphatase